MCDVSREVKELLGEPGGGEGGRFNLAMMSIYNWLLIGRGPES